MASPSQRAAGRSAERGGVPGLAPLLKSAPTRWGAVGELRVGRAACLEYTSISTGIHKYIRGEMCLITYHCIQDDLTSLS